jgi:hypothetical protein
MATAIWNVTEIAAMNAETNLRNKCRQLEQEYVEWKRPATYRGFLLSHEWPAIGELGRLRAPGVVVCFVTTKKRTVQVQLPDGTVVADCKIKPGLANELYLEAGRIFDASEMHS